MSQTQPHSGARRALDIGVCVTLALALVGFAWFMVAGDGKDQLDARVFKKSAVDDPVLAWFAHMRSAADQSTTKNHQRALGVLTDGAQHEMQAADRRAQREGIGRVDRGRTLIDAFFGDPMVWANRISRDVAPGHAPHLKVDVIDGDHAKVAAVGGFVVRYALSGCLAAHESFQVVRGDNGWLIERVPAELFEPLPPAGNCTATELRTSWRAAPSYKRGIQVLDKDGLPAWAGDRLQRSKPVGAEADPDSATATNTATSRTLPRYAIDPENRSGPAEGITAWRTSPARAVGTELVFSLGARVRLARIRLHNGVNNRALSSDYARHGRIARAVLSTSTRAVTVDLEDTPDLVTIDCDFGVTDTVRLRIDDVFPGRRWVDPAESDVALSDIGFWGAPPPLPSTTARVDSEDETAGSLGDLHFACPRRN